MHLGRRVRDLRSARHLSQVELAARAGVARNTLNRIENGHLMPTAPIIEHLAEALDVAPGALFEEPVPEVSAPPKTGRHIPVAVHDSVPVDDAVKHRLVPHFEALIYELGRVGLEKEVAEVERMRDELLATV